MGLGLVTETIASKIRITMFWAVYDGGVPIRLAFSFHFGVEKDRLVKKSGLLGYGVGPQQRAMVEAQSWVP